MFHKTIIVAALAGALSCLAQQAIAQDSRAGPCGRLADLERGQTPADPRGGRRGILAGPSGGDR